LIAGFRAILRTVDYRKAPLEMHTSDDMVEDVDHRLPFERLMPHPLAA